MCFWQRHKYQTKSGVFYCAVSVKLTVGPQRARDTSNGVAMYAYDRATLTHSHSPYCTCTAVHRGRQSVRDACTPTDKLKHERCELSCVCVVVCACVLAYAYVCVPVHACDSPDCCIIHQNAVQSSKETDLNESCNSQSFGCASVRVSRVTLKTINKQQLRCVWFGFALNTNAS